MKLIGLPSGVVINFEQVAFITAVNGLLNVSFSATYTTERERIPMTLKLDNGDTNALLEFLAANGVETKPIFNALTRKPNRG
jgi:hypothetical protein